MITVNGHVLTPTIFPDSTSQVWKLPNGVLSDPLLVDWRFEAEREIFDLITIRMLCPEAMIDLYKAPKTDSGMKNSAKGLLRVETDLSLKECVTAEEEAGGMLRTIFEDGKVLRTETLSQIRARLRGI